MRRLKLNTLLKIGLLSVTLLLAACGDTGSTSSGVPAPAAPNNTGGTLPIVPNTDSRLPDLTGAQPINLQDKVNFTALKEIYGSSGEVLLNLVLVGDPLINMRLNRKTAVTGKVLIGFEYGPGFWGAELPTVEGATVLTSTNFDTIHSDSELSFRILGAITGNDIYGVIYYRVRKQTPTMEIQCLAQTRGCFIGSKQVDDRYCTYPTNAISAASMCRDYYMSPSDSNVKFMGSFTAKVSDWFKN